MAPERFLPPDQFVFPCYTPKPQGGMGEIFTEVSRLFRAQILCLDIFFQVTLSQVASEVMPGKQTVQQAMTVPVN